MKTIKLLSFSLFVLLIGTTSCIYDTVEGNGIRATESRITGSFDKVKSSGSFEVYISKGDEYEVLVSAEENVIPFIETRVIDGILKIEIEDRTSIRNDIPMKIFITMPELRGLKLSGSGTIDTDYFECNEMDILVSGSGQITTACDTRKLEISISGSGSIDISGNTKNAEFVISGSGNIKAANLTTEDCISKISGSGNVWIQVDNFLEARISGSGSVYYYGEPQIEKNISGSGNVIRQN